MGAECGVAGCGEPSVGSLSVRVSVWFVSESSYDNERDIWNIGGVVAPQWLHGMMQACEHHMGRVNAEVG